MKMTMALSTPGNRTISFTFQPKLHDKFEDTKINQKPSIKGQTIGWPTEDGQTIGQPTEDGQTIGWPTEDGQTIGWPTEDGQTMI